VRLKVWYESPRVLAISSVSPSVKVGQVTRTLLLIAALNTSVGAMELLTVGSGTLAVDVCKIALGKDVVRTFWRDADGSYFGSIDRVANRLNQQGEKLACASNAGIYGKDLRPLGLYVEYKRIFRHLNTRKEGYGNFYVQPNGVFWITQTGAHIGTTDEVQSNWDQIVAEIRFAIQSGPILFSANKINPIFTQGSENRLVRNGICVKSDTEFALAKSRYPINFYDFATVLRDEVGCRDGLYLDGSISELFPFEKPLRRADFGPMIGVVQSIGR
jgi:uncharacterized protein YigE (DUF2233 family)